jgi:hypothetical protein
VIVGDVTGKGCGGVADDLLPREAYALLSAGLRAT